MAGYLPGQIIRFSASKKSLIACFSSTFRYPEEPRLRFMLKTRALFRSLHASQFSCECPQYGQGVISIYCSITLFIGDANAGFSGIAEGVMIFAVFIGQFHFAPVTGRFHLCDFEQALLALYVVHRIGR